VLIDTPEALIDTRETLIDTVETPLDNGAQFSDCLLNDIQLFIVHGTTIVASSVPRENVRELSQRHGKRSRICELPARVIGEILHPWRRDVNIPKSQSRFEIGHRPDCPSNVAADARRETACGSRGQLDRPISSQSCENHAHFSCGRRAHHTLTDRDHVPQRRAKEGESLGRCRRGAHYQRARCRTPRQASAEGLLRSGLRRQLVKVVD
jgi:hypothetical protein